MPGKTIAYARKTGVGLVRMNNEDNQFVDAGKTLFCAADGMGGGQEGETASRIVCEEIEKVDIRGDFVERLERVELAIAKADIRIRDIARVSGYDQMGSTASVLVVDHEYPSRAAIHYIGDTRVYRVREATLEQLTRDHTVAGGGDRSNPMAHMLTRAIGTGPFKPGDWKVVDVKHGDKIVICSDGLHDVITDHLLSDIMNATDDVEEISDLLERYILHLGAPDNYTYFVLKIGG